ncbi:hypothetical protein LCGC14_1437260 [marine sediment metagenome]|uniref:Uncharacterized protein n=1 Tax=marine sediment metagenome TaxID=412755 RepID=A0A0F9MNQ2_9ZZZZ
MIKKYRITNYGNTRTVYVKGQSWEISKNDTIEISDYEIDNAQEVADAFEELEFVDVEVIEQPTVKSSKKKKKVSKRGKKVTTRKKSKKIKRRKVKRRLKNE